MHKWNFWGKLKSYEQIFINFHSTVWKQNLLYNLTFLKGEKNT